MPFDLERIQYAYAEACQSIATLGHWRWSTTDFDSEDDDESDELEPTILCKNVFNSMLLALEGENGPDGGLAVNDESEVIYGLVKLAIEDCRDEYADNDDLYQAGRSFIDEHRADIIPQGLLVVQELLKA